MAYELCGIRIADASQITLRNRIRRWLHQRGETDVEAYLYKLRSGYDADAVASFVDTITTRETSFFRIADHFAWFSNAWFDEVMALARHDQRERHLRIWSAACSTGEEAYSLAMCLQENQFRLAQWNIDVVGTDVSQQALQQARQGLYRDRSLQAVGPEQRRRFFSFVAEQNAWQVKPDLQALVTFEHHNLLQPYGRGAFDCIFLRNVMIYFDQQSKRTVVEHVLQRLAAGGYLVVGLSEGISDLLTPLVKRGPSVFQNGSF